MDRGFIPDFLLIPHQLFSDRTLSSVDMLVYGVVYYLSKLSGERCFASNALFARILSVQPRKVSESLSRLVERGYIEIRYSDAKMRNRTEIIPLVSFNLKQAELNMEDPIVRKDIHDSPSGHSTIVRSDNRLRIYTRRVINTPELRSDEKNGKEINQFIALFSVINPNVPQIMKRKPQREAASRLLVGHDIQYWASFMQAYAQKMKTDRFCPKATTPIQFEENLGKILAYASSSQKPRGKQVI